MAFTIGQDWIEDARTHLQGSYVERRNTLAANYTAGSGSITLSYADAQIVQGSMLSIGLNNFYVMSFNNSTLVATVIGGQSGSTDANASAGALVRVNPQFTDWDIWKALGADLADLSSPLNGLYSMQYTDFNYQSNIVQYDLGSSAAISLIEIYQLRHLTPGSFKDFDSIPKESWELILGAYTGDIPNGIGVSISNPYKLFPSYKVRAFWKSAFVLPSDPTQNLSTSLVPATAYDLPPIGAAIHIMAGREIMRNSPQQQDYRRATEVPAGAVAASPNNLKQIRQARIDAEAARLQNMYPPYRD